MAISKSNIVNTADIETVDKPSANIPAENTSASHQTEAQPKPEIDPLIELLNEKIGSLGVLLFTNISKCFWPTIAVILVFKM